MLGGEGYTFSQNSPRTRPLERSQPSRFQIVAYKPTSSLYASNSQLDYNSGMSLPGKSSGESPNELTKKKDPFVSLARYSEIGFILPSAVLLGFFLGKLLDYWLHTKWLYLVGLLFGAVVGFWQVIRMALGAFGKDSDSSPPND